MVSYPKILILFVAQGAAHQRAAKALRKAMLDLRPDAQVEVIDILQHCTPWFRIYYNSYLIILKLWPGLWRRIEKIQHQSKFHDPGMDLSSRVHGPSSGTCATSLPAWSWRPKSALVNLPPCASAGKKSLFCW